MKLVLIIEPQLLDRTSIMREFAQDGIPLEIVDPLLAARAVQTISFDLIVVPIEKIEDPLYGPLFAMMKLVAPESQLIKVASKQATEHS